MLRKITGCGWASIVTLLILSCGGGNEGSGDSSTVGDGIKSTGTLTCAQVSACMDNCKDDACYEGCYNTGTAQAQQQLEALAACYAKPNEACENQMQTCYQQSCTTQIENCKNDQSTGGKTCQQIMSCYNACQDEACVKSCYDQGTVAAKSLADAIDSCLNTSCFPQYDSCYQQGCAAEVQACGV